MHGDGCITYGKCVGLKLLKKKMVTRNYTMKIHIKLKKEIK